MATYMTVKDIETMGMPGMRRTADGGWMHESADSRLVVNDAPSLHPEADARLAAATGGGRWVAHGAATPEERAEIERMLNDGPVRGLGASSVVVDDAAPVFRDVKIGDQLPTLAPIALLEWLCPNIGRTRAERIAPLCVGVPIGRELIAAVRRHWVGPTAVAREEPLTLHPSTRLDAITIGGLAIRCPVVESGSPDGFTLAARVDWEMCRTLQTACLSGKPVAIEANGRTRDATPLKFKAEKVPRGNGAAFDVTIEMRWWVEAIPDAGTLRVDNEGEAHYSPPSMTWNGVPAPDAPVDTARAAAPAKPWMLRSGQVWERQMSNSIQRRTLTEYSPSGWLVAEHDRPVDGHAFLTMPEWRYLGTREEVAAAERVTYERRLAESEATGYVERLDPRTALPLVPRDALSTEALDQISDAVAIELQCGGGLVEAFNDGHRIAVEAVGFTPTDIDGAIRRGWKRGTLPTSHPIVSRPFSDPPPRAERAAQPYRLHGDVLPAGVAREGEAVFGVGRETAALRALAVDWAKRQPTAAHALNHLRHALCAALATDNVTTDLDFATATVTVTAPGCGAIAIARAIEGAKRWAPDGCEVVAAPASESIGARVAHIAADSSFRPGTESWFLSILSYAFRTVPIGAFRLDDSTPGIVKVSAPQCGVTMGQLTEACAALQAQMPLGGASVVAAMPTDEAQRLRVAQKMSEVYNAANAAFDNAERAGMTLRPAEEIAACVGAKAADPLAALRATIDALIAADSGPFAHARAAALRAYGERLRSVPQWTEHDDPTTDARTVYRLLCEHEAKRDPRRDGGSRTVSALAEGRSDFNVRALATYERERARSDAYARPSR